MSGGPASNQSLKLEVDGQGTKENPGMTEIARGLASLDGESAAFASLGRDDLTYIQASGSPADGFSIEYQDGSLQKHYRCTRDLSLDEATKTFQSYAKGETQWQTDNTWEQIEI